MDVHLLGRVGDGEWWARFSSVSTPLWAYATARWILMYKPQLQW